MEVDLALLADAATIDASGKLNILGVLCTFYERTNVSRDVENVPGVFVYDVDDLQGIVLGDEERITVFTADHGESLGEHGYWGHGRHLYEPTLRIPMAIVWEGKLAPRGIGDLAEKPK